MKWCLFWFDRLLTQRLNSQHLILTYKYEIIAARFNTFHYSFPCIAFSTIQMFLKELFYSSFHDECKPAKTLKATNHFSVETACACTTNVRITSIKNWNIWTDERESPEQKSAKGIEWQKTITAFSESGMESLWKRVVRLSVPIFQDDACAKYIFDKAPLHFERKTVLCTKCGNTINGFGVIKWSETQKNLVFFLLYETKRKYLQVFQKILIH